jgi:lipopolysaccharide export system protein LptC
MRLLKETWERFLLYLPLVFMGSLALGTYWLVRSTPAVVSSDIQRPLRHDPDYFLERFTLKTFDAAGHIRTEVFGAKARHYPDTRWLEIDEIRIRSFDDKGRLTTAHATRGMTNEDTSQVQLIGDAVVVREADAAAGVKAAPRMEFRGEFLHAFMLTEVVKSHKPVQLLRGNDRFNADSLEFDNVDQVLQLKGRVRASLVPDTHS